MKPSISGTLRNLFIDPKEHCKGEDIRTDERYHEMALEIGFPVSETLSSPILKTLHSQQQRDCRKQKKQNPV